MIFRSVSDLNSSFTQDLTRMSRVYQSIQNRSLVFIDEFGKGTSPEDGIALFLALTHSFLSSSFAESFFFLSTHFSDYLTEELLNYPLNQLTLKQMKVLLDTTQEHSVTPLFQVMDGICEDALGIQVASALGLPDTMIQRSEEVYHCIHENRDIPLQEALMHTTNQKVVEQIIEKLFQMNDWNLASKEELQSLMQLMSSIQSSVC